MQQLRRKRRGLPHLVLAFACVATWLTPGAASAREINAVSTEFPGVIELDASGQPAGYGVDLLNRLASENGHSVRLELFPWARAQHMVATGKAQILLGAYRSAEREKLFRFAAQPFFRDEMVFYATTATPSRWKGNYNELENLPIGVANGWLYSPEFERHRAHLRLVTSNTIDDGLRLLARNITVLYVGNQRDVDPVVRKLGLEQTIAVVEPTLGHDDAFFAFAQDPESDALRQAFDASFARLVQRGELRTLASRYHVTLPPNLR